MKIVIEVVAEGEAALDLRRHRIAQDPTFDPKTDLDFDFPSRSRRFFVERSDGSIVLLGLALDALQDVPELAILRVSRSDA
jgi:hypothetical protein